MPITLSRYGALILLGALSVVLFAPFRQGYLAPCLLAAVLLLLPRHNAAQAGRGIYLWALSAYCANFYWIYHSLHDIAGLPAVFAIPLVALLPAWLALFPAAALYFTYRLSWRNPYWQWLLAFPSLWTFFDWMRGWLLTGFSWGGLGYSQIPNWPLAGLAPLFGIYAVTWAVVASAGALVLLWRFPKRRQWLGLGLAVAWVGSWGLSHIQWTEASGKPLSISLVQGNIPQTLKWEPTIFAQTLDTYTQHMTASQAKLVILPETALPIFYDELPANYLQPLQAILQQQEKEVITGIPLRDMSGDYNGVISLTQPTQQYRKAHLVPFGEYVPLPWLTGWLYRYMNMPLSGFTRGEPEQQPFTVADQRIAFNICYEDSFGEELLAGARSATLLANVSNLAWFGHSTAAEQHLQLSQARALETGRPMLRATNTGLTAVIDQRGQVLQSLPQFHNARLDTSVQGRQGETPYLRWGNWPVLIALLLAIVLSFSYRRPSDHR